MDYLPIPRFSSEKLAIWFAQTESVFTLNGVISDSDKYDYVVSHIPTEYTSIVEDIVLNPPPDSKYDHLKYEFIKRMSVYYLKKEKLDGDMPSEYLRRLRDLADKRVPIELVLNIWLKNLPRPVREVVSLETSGHVDIISQMADKVMALLPIAEQDNTTHQSDQYDTIIRRIDELTKQLQIVQMMLDEDVSVEQQQLLRKQERAALTGNSRNEDKAVIKIKRSPPNMICWYHTVFGERAIACIAPCHFGNSTSPNC